MGILDLETGNCSRLRGRGRSSMGILCWSDLTEQAKIATDPLKSEQLRRRLRVDYCGMSKYSKRTQGFSCSHESNVARRQEARGFHDLPPSTSVRRRIALSIGSDTQIATRRLPVSVCFQSSTEDRPTRSRRNPLFDLPLSNLHHASGMRIPEGIPQSICLRRPLFLASLYCQFSNFPGGQGNHGVRPGIVVKPPNDPLEEIGTGGRNRTHVFGFGDRCVTTTPRRCVLPFYQPPVSRATRPPS